LNFAKAARTGLSEEEIEKMNAATEIVAVIEIHQDASTGKDTKTQRSEMTNHHSKHTTEVKPEAIEAAHTMFRTHRSAIVATKYRIDLEQIFNQVFPNGAEVSFAEILFAMAKGLKLVNVFNKGKDLEWHIGKYQPPKIETRLKKFVGPDGFAMMAKTAPKPDRSEIGLVVQKSSEPVPKVDPIEALKFATQDLKETEEFIQEYRQKYHEISDKIKGMVAQYEAGAKNKRVLARVLDFEDDVFNMTKALLDDLQSARESFYDEKENWKSKI
jgi:hypothetical protein